jgi:hypothetical protein
VTPADGDAWPKALPDTCGGVYVRGVLDPPDSDAGASAQAPNVRSEYEKMQAAGAIR